MRILLIANTIFEIAIGCLFIIVPTVLVKNNDLVAISLLRVIGCGAFALGILSFFMLQLTERKELKPGLIALSVFHTMVAIAQFFNLLEGRTIIAVVIIHSAFAISFISVSWKQFRWK